MRKQTKLVAVASAAALLAIGASMTSFAATGWVEEDGNFYYYDKDGNRVEDEWKKSGDYWFWLDSEEDGAMATEKLIEDGDYTYYVGEDGAMVKNTWIAIENEDYEDEDDAEYNWYYFQSNGRAYKGDGETLKKRTINGKKYTFDEDGKMMFGWLDANGQETDWDEATYFFGNWEDGAMKTGWQKITVEDEDEDEDVDYWFAFKSSGVKRTGEWKTGGKKYLLDGRGVMVSQWYYDGTTPATATASTSASDWMYFNSPEDGAKTVKGWFKVVAPTEDTTFNEGLTDKNSFDYSNADTDSAKWYYADADGYLYKSQIAKINGKYYAFNSNGSMMYGLCLLNVDEAGNIVAAKNNITDEEDFEDYIDVNATGYKYGAYTFYVFGGSSDGAMKTGNVNVEVEGTTYNFKLAKTGGEESRGAGFNGLDDGKYFYLKGMKVKASSEDKYALVEYVEADNKVAIIDSADLRKDRDTLGKNADDETVKAAKLGDAKYILVNTSGAIQKNKNGVKDGEGWYFFTDDDGYVTTYADNKKLPSAE